MPIFAETISKAINNYRYLLRRHLTQAERITKLQSLRLKDPETYSSDMSLYRTAVRIIKDIEENIGIPEQGYYSYSGIGKFCDYLKEYLSNYEVENGHLVHRAQKASRAMLEAIQLISLSDNFDDPLKKKLIDCNKIVVAFGSNEQQELFKLNIERQITRNPDFLEPVLDDLERRLHAVESKNQSHQRQTQHQHFASHHHRSAGHASKEHVADG